MDDEKMAINRRETLSVVLGVIGVLGTPFVYSAQSSIIELAVAEMTSNRAAYVELADGSFMPLTPGRVYLRWNQRPVIAYTESSTANVAVFVNGYREVGPISPGA